MFFKKNEGNVDRAIRAILAVVLFAVGFFLLSDTLQLIAYIAAAVSLFTAITGFCGLYKLLGITTCPMKSQ